MPTAETRQIALLFYPLLRLSRVYALAKGDIGPVRDLADTYHLPASLMRHFSQYRVDDEPIRDASGALGWDFDALRKEMEIVAYVADLRHVDAVEEIFSERVDIRFDAPPGRGGSIDGAITLDDLEQLSGVRFENRPGSFSSWDTSALDDFEPQIAGVLDDPVKTALVECIPVITDGEANAERRRLVISVQLYNEAFVQLAKHRPVSFGQVVLLGAAFEALLNLPNETVTATFRHAVMTLSGTRTTLMRRWCTKFYEARSRAVHGSTEWYSGDQMFQLERGSVGHAWLGRAVFAHCLKAKLHLMGLLPEYKPRPFDFEPYDRFT